MKAEAKAKARADAEANRKSGEVAKKLDEEKIKAEKASVLTARYLWNFLSGMSTKHRIQVAA